MYAHKFEPGELGDSALPSPQIPVVYQGDILCGTKVHLTGYAVLLIPEELVQKIESGSAMVTIEHSLVTFQPPPGGKTEELTKIEIIDWGA